MIPIDPITIAVAHLKEERLALIASIDRIDGLIGRLQDMRRGIPFDGDRPIAPAPAAPPPLPLSEDASDQRVLAAVKHRTGMRSCNAVDIARTIGADPFAVRAALDRLVQRYLVTKSGRYRSTRYEAL